MNRVAIHTLGCKVNFSDSSTIARQFVQRGYRVVDSAEPCDVFVLNTCSVTERADKECRQIIRRALRNSPDAYVVVTGCYAQLQPQEIASISGVDLVLGASDKFNAFDRAGEFRKGQPTQIYVSCIDEPLEFVSSHSGEADGRTRAYLKVQDGCDYSCSFCTIPLARGSSRSMPIDDVVGRARPLAEDGFKEIVLTGVNVGDYGSSSGSSLYDLVRSLDEVDIERIRISSIEPNLLTPQLVDFILGSERFCNHFHVPLQSGSDRILKKMRRRYLTQQYRQLAAYIKSQDPTACIGADVLVGFPGETDELFAETRGFIEETPIDYLHVFTYSERENTDAPNMEGVVDIRIRHERNEILRAIGAAKRASFYAKSIGKTEQVLFETPDDDGIQAGWTKNYTRVAVNHAADLSNEIVPVAINSLRDGRCVGTVSIPGETHIVDEKMSNLSEIIR